MSKRPKIELVTLDEVVDTISGQVRGDEDGLHLVYMSGDRHGDRRVIDALIDRLNHPDTVARICHKFKWHWVAFGRVSPGWNDPDEVYCIAHIRGPKKPVFPTIDWDKLISSLIANHSDMFERAKHGRVTFYACTADGPIVHARHFPLTLLEKRLPHLSITALEWEDLILLVAGPKGSLGSE